LGGRVGRGESIAPRLRAQPTSIPAVVLSPSELWVDVGVEFGRSGLAPGQTSLVRLGGGDFALVETAALHIAPVRWLLGRDCWG